MLADVHIAEPLHTRSSARAGVRSTGRLVGGVSTSIGLHLLAALILYALSQAGWLGANSSSLAPDVEEEVEVVPVAPSDWDRNLTDEPAPPPSERDAAKHKDAPTPKKKAPESTPSGQVVDVAQGNDEKPDETSYLAEHNNKVAKETRAKDQTAFYGKAMPKQTTVQPVEKSVQDKTRVHGDQGTGTDDAKKAQKAQIAAHEIPTAADPEKIAKLERSEDGEARTPDDAKNLAGNSNRLLLKPGALLSGSDHSADEGKAGTPDAPDQPSSAAAPDKSVGAAPNDFLQGLPTGDGTFLNTKEFKYAGFFNRIKQRVGEQWNPNDAMRRRDPQGRHSSYLDRVTVVDVTLDAEGRVANIHINQSCGVDFLDEEAVAAFERAQPFLNPPSGILDENGLVRFNFGFHIDNQQSNPLLSPLQGHRGRMR